MQGFVLLISGPSGAGKSTLLKKLFDEFEDELYFSISSTTRKPREGEKMEYIIILYPMKNFKKV